MHDKYEPDSKDLKKMANCERKERLVVMEFEDYNSYADACFVERLNEKIHKEEAWAY